MKADLAPDDERLLIEQAQRDPGRFADLYERHFARVYAYVARRVWRREEAEDVTSEVFEAALANLPRFEWRGVSFLAWLLRIASNTMADRSKRARREVPAPDHEIPEPAEMQEIERRAMLFELVDELPADQRRVVVGRFVEEKSIRDLAGELGRTEGAVKQLQLRAMQNLRERMGRAHA